MEQMTKSLLTRNDRKLIGEIQAIIERLNLDPKQIATEKDAENRRELLKGARLHLIRGEVITQFTLIDELLTHEVAIEMLGGKAAKPWKRKRVRFERAKSLLTESRMSMRHKLELYRVYRRAPRNVAQIIAELNKLRNALAHVFFVEGRHARANYRGQDILNPSTFDTFLDDMSLAFEFFVSR